MHLNGQLAKERNAYTGGREQGANGRTYERDRNILARNRDKKAVEKRKTKPESEAKKKTNRSVDQRRNSDSHFACEVLP